MIRIICDKCKNGYLEKNENGFCCTSCGAAYPADAENTLIGIQHYSEGNYAEADSALMKALVTNSKDHLALFYKGMCDAAVFDEDTLSFADSYKKAEYAVALADDGDLPSMLEKADTEAARFEREMTELHVKAFEDADAEKIKHEVAVILKIRDEALAFRASLKNAADAYNERNERKIITRFSKCRFVSPELANEVGCAKLAKISDDISTHTVFTGILTNDIRNLEIYYRCVVMFFDKSKEKYNFLLDNAKKFTSLTDMLKEGGYNTVSGTDEIAEKLRLAAYGFFEDSLKEHDDEYPETAEPLPVVEFEPLPEPPEEEKPAEEDPTIIAIDDAAIEEIKEAADKAKEADEADTPEEPADGGEPAEPEEAPETAEAEDADGESVESEPETETAEETEDAETSDDGSDEAASADDEKSVSEVSAEEIAESLSFREKSSAKAPQSIADASVETIFDPTADSLYSLKKAALAQSEITGEIIFEKKTASETAEFKKIEPTDTKADIPAAEEKADEPAEKSDVQPPKKAEVEKKTDEKEKPAATTRSRKKKKKKHIPLIIFILILVAAAAYAGWKFVPEMINDKKYAEAAALEAQNDFDAAAQSYKALGDYKDSADKVLECIYMSAGVFEDKGEYQKAIDVYKTLEDYKDCPTRINACEYELAKAALDSGDFDTARERFTALADYGDSAEKAKESDYRKALTLIEAKDYPGALALLREIKDYPDAAAKISEVKYLYVTENLTNENKTVAKIVRRYLNELAKADYRNSADLLKEIVGEEAKASVEVFVNGSAADLTEKLTEISRSSKIYFHIKAVDASVYGKKITLTYRTQYGYKYNKTVTLTKSSPTAYLDYPASSLGNYTVTFTASVDGNVIGTEITVKVK